MKNKGEFRSVIKHGLVQVAVATRVYLDTHELEDGDSEELSNMLADELESSVHEVLSLNREDFARLVDIEAIGAEACQRAIEEAIKKDGEPTHIC